MLAVDRPLSISTTGIVIRKTYTATNLCRAHLHMYGVPRVAHAYPLPPSVFHDPLQRPVRPLLRLTQLAARRVAGAAQRPLYHHQPPLYDRPTVFVARTLWGTRRGTCRTYVLRPANQLRTLVRFTDQMTSAGMRNGRSHSRPQMCIDTSCDVAKLAVTLAQGRVLEPERRSNPFTRSIFSFSGYGRIRSVS